LALGTWTLGNLRFLGAWGLGHLGFWAFGLALGLGLLGI
jgi:hypothetical protein